MHHPSPSYAGSDPSSEVEGSLKPGDICKKHWRGFILRAVYMNSEAFHFTYPSDGVGAGKVKWFFKTIYIRR